MNENQELTSTVFSFSPKGESMWPFLKHKKQSVVIDSSITPKNYDVILFVRNNGEKVLHRVIEILPDAFICSGDSVLKTEKVGKDAVVGVMTGYYKKDVFICVRNEKYQNRVISYYKNPRKRQRKIKRFSFRLKLKNKLKKVLGK